MLKRLLLALAFGLAASPVHAGDPLHVEGEAIVTFRAGADGARAAHRGELRTRPFRELSRRQGRTVGVVREPGTSTAELIEKLRADSAVEHVEPNHLRWVRASPGAPDPEFPKLWGLENTGQWVNGVAGSPAADIGYRAAWRMARPVTGEAIVGVIDTGVDLSHPDLADNLWTNPGEIPGNGIDDDGNGYADDVHGYDFSLNTGNVTDSGDHGTHVAGTLAASGRNGIGITGANPRAKILPLKVSSNGDTMSTSAILEAFDYVIALKNAGANIVALNASYSGPTWGLAERNAIVALRDAGIILCAAAGNDGENNDIVDNYPADYTVSNIVSVAALDSGNNLAAFSNFGATSVDIAAPGAGIYSARPVAHVTAAASVAVGGSAFAAAALEFAGGTTQAGISGNVVPCGIGLPGEFPSGVTGNIALIERGTITFAEKVASAAAAGASAALIYDNTSSSLASGGWTLGTAGEWLPVLQITRATGLAILAQLPASAQVVAFRDPALAYQFRNGTSMATPHVAAAVAFAAMHYPQETVAQRIGRVLGSATPLPSLTGKTITGGALNLAGIVDGDGNGLPDWWEIENFGATGQSPDEDSDGDGANHAAEFLTGTDPADPSSRSALGIAGLELAFATIPHRLYQLEWSDDLDSWQPLGPAAAGDGSPVVASDPEEALQRFYRLKVSFID